MNTDDMKLTNQERLVQGITDDGQLHRGFGIRVQGAWRIQDKPKFLVNNFMIPTHIIGTESFRKPVDEKKQTRQQLREESSRNKNIKKNLRKR